ncbi:MAG: phosphate acyltransferase PlsX [Clostridiales bacterium]|jgi:glycerol-3-phosphate acyltransferase PlsX|nr:phosphate acyltransferase PlsX [Clostridiales bacterium]
MRIIVDAMGGDFAPVEILKGCIDAVGEYGILLTLVGQEEVITEHLQALGASLEPFEIINATEVVEPDEVPVTAIRRKKDSSMVKAFELLRQDPESVFISAGSTGALMAGGLLKVGRIKGINRPALAPLIPTKEQPVLLVDAGANAECKPENLVQFAIMGSVYMEQVLDRKNPSVGLVNIGTEEGKGNELTKETYIRLKEQGNINFFGNVEARDIPAGIVDIVVCDGFTGNIILKLTEGLATNLFAIMKEEFTKGLIPKIGALLLKPSLKGLKDTMDYAEHGGAPLLGINGGIIKAHGSSDARAIKNAIRQGKKFAEQQVLKNIKSRIVGDGEEV